MGRDWPGSDYDLLRHNCCHFSDALCQALGVGPIPGWVTSLAGVGAMLRSGIKGGRKRIKQAPQKAADAVAGVQAQLAAVPKPLAAVPEVQDDIRQHLQRAASAR